MRSRPIRRAQLISPFGVGAMVVMPDGNSLMGAGLDHWFEREGGDTDSRRIDIDEFRVEEWRLQRLLRVSHFRLPPDYREFRPGEAPTNTGLTVPYVRFPQWHFCSRCDLLMERPLAEHGRIRCPECEAGKHYGILRQVPFVAMCSYGHIQDFPWREWVHRTGSPPTGEKMRLVATGSATLAGQEVRCECGKRRTLGHITEASEDGTTTYLSSNLMPGARFNCQGQMPWHGGNDSQRCALPLRGTLRSASNVYYSTIRSALYLPRTSGAVPSELVSLLEEPPLSTLLHLLKGSGVDIGPDVLRSQQPQLLDPFSDDQVQAAITLVVGNGAGAKDAIPREIEGDDAETAFRRPEFEVLRTTRDDQQLSIRQLPIGEYAGEIRKHFSRIMLVDKLRETRALVGFNRVFPEQGHDIDNRKALLRRKPPERPNDWLPAYTVYGEGIFLEFHEKSIHAWEQGDRVKARVAPLVAHYSDVQQNRKLQQRSVTSRFVLVHTLAHLLMNRLTFECGYSSAALRERLYVSSGPGAEMAGLLIYTAAGDAEGTMGGLVRMGKPGNLEAVLQRALEGAQWCSADPVCMEAGERGGQGPDSCNLAACHNCSLVPETACEEFNRFLDRALLVGSLSEPGLGFFGARVPDGAQTQLEIGTTAQV